MHQAMEIKNKVRTPLGWIPKSSFGKVLKLEPFYWGDKYQDWIMRIEEITWANEDGDTKTGTKTVVFDIMQEQLEEIMTEWRMTTITDAAIDELIKRSQPAIAAYRLRH